MQPQASARGTDKARQVSGEASRLRDGQMHRGTRDAAPALGPGHRVRALQASGVHEAALQEAAKRQRALQEQQLQVRAVREDQGRVRHPAAETGECTCMRLQLIRRPFFDASV